jgi:hypothetical protein
MKHQYFGDVSDYKKYSVLRAISDNGQLRTMVAWLLTPNDQRNDGNVNKYLNNPSEWRQFEPDIFDFLYEAVVVNQTKDLHLVEEKEIVPGTSYFWDILADNLVERKKYFEKLKEASKEHEIVFLDPDNGIATGSITKGRKNSSKYAFWDEISDLWNQEHSLLIYQHFPRVNRMEYIKRKVDEINDRLSNNETYAIRTTHMVYFLIPQEGHSLHFEGLKEKIEGKWGEGRIGVERF